MPITLSCLTNVLLGMILGTSTTAQAHESIYLESLFEEAKGAAALAASTAARKTSRGEGSALGVEAWVAQHGEALAADLRATVLEWVEELPSTCPRHACACTTLSPASPILLSRSVCKRRPIDVKLAKKLLLHESVHHLGTQDETFADAVAIAVYAAAAIEAQAIVVRSTPGARLALETSHATETAEDEGLVASVTARLGKSRLIESHVTPGASVGTRLGSGHEMHAIYRQTTVSLEFEIPSFSSATGEETIEREVDITLRTYGAEYRYIAPLSAMVSPTLGLGYGLTTLEGRDRLGYIDAIEPSRLTYIEAQAGVSVRLRPKVALIARGVRVEYSKEDGNWIMPQNLFETGVAMSF